MEYFTYALRGTKCISVAASALRGTRGLSVAASAGAVVVTVAVVAVYRRWTYEPILPQLEIKDAGRNIRIGLNKKTCPKRADAIVVGSGLGGLTTAALLARRGKKVVVLEQHDVAGGCTHAYSTKQFTFDVGLHYVGGDLQNPKSSMAKLFNYLCTTPVQWISQGDVIDRCKKHDFELDVGKVKDYLHALKTRFPDETEKIDAYFQEIKKAKSFKLVAYPLLWKICPAALQSLLYNTLLKKHLAYVQTTLKDVTDRLDMSADLAFALGYACGDYGAAPQDAPFFVHALVQAHYFRGGFYPEGGAESIARAIVPTIQRAGGSVLVKASVNEILVDAGHVVGVSVSNLQGQTFTIHAPVVVSAAGALTTINNLVSESTVRTHWPGADTITNLRTGMGHVNLFVGLEGVEEPLPKYNLRSSTVHADPGQNPLELLTASSEPPFTISPPFSFIAFPSAKDPAYKAEHGGRDCCTIVAESNYGQYMEWAESKHGKRPADYIELKAAVKENLLERMYTEFPQTRGKVTYVTLGTPLTNDHYIGSYEGSSYGIELSTRRLEAMIAPRTPIKGLYLSGQDVTYSCGIFSGMYGGWTAAMAIDWTLIRPFIRAMM